MCRPTGHAIARRPAHRSAIEPAGPAAGGILALALPALLALAAAGCERVPEIELAAGVRRAGELARGEVHAYRLRSPAARAVELVVDQREEDLALTVLGADGEPRVTADRTESGEERLFLLAEAGVRYRLEVSGYDGAAGPYEVRVESVRPPLTADRRRAEAELALARAQAQVGGSERADWMRAADRYREALAIFRELGDLPRQAEVEQDLGRLHRSELEDARTALGHYGAAIELYRELGDEDRESVVLNSLGRLHFELGEIDRAEELYRRALSLKQATGDREGESATFGNLAQVARYRGEAQAALTDYGRSIEILQDLEDDSGGHRLLYLGRALNNRGKLYLALGELDQALSDLERAVAIGGDLLAQPRPSARDRRSAQGLQAIALSGLGTIRHLRGELEEAAAVLERALELREQVGAVQGRATTRLALARVHADLGRRRQAIEGYRRALARYRELEVPRGEAHALVALSDEVERRGEPAEALRFAGEALELFGSLGDRAGEIDALLALARAQRSLDRSSDEALDTARQALAIAEALRREAATPDLRASYFAALRDQFDLYVEMLMDRHWSKPDAGFDRRALEESERFRARSLLDLLRASRDAALDRADPELFARLEQIETRIRLLGQDRDEASGDELAGLEARLGELVRQRGELVGRIRGAAPPVAAPEPAPILDLAGIQALLEPGTALLEYHLGARRSRLWVVTATSLTVVELAPRDEIERAARAAHRVLEAGYGPQHASAVRRDLAALAALVIDPAAGALDAERLLVAADGALHYVPFAALPVPGAAQERLIDRHRIAMVPSASALAALRRGLARRPRAPGTVAVIGDPVFGAADPRWPASAPGAVGEPRRLPFAGEEADAVLSLVPRGERLGALGLDATRERAMAPELGRFGIVHFATHAYIDPERPELSRLLLSRVDRAGRPRDGSLYAFELPQLDLAADLVTLSGCETALGREIRGEGLVGLTQGFFEAGAAQVLVSLWPVDDRATAELMRRFYQGLLAENQTPEAALRAAQLSVQEVERWRVPYYWAGFVLQGEGRVGGR